MKTVIIMGSTSDEPHAKKITNKYSKFDFIIATNFFAQTNNLEEILKSIKLILDKNGLLIVEVQYLYELLLQKDTT